MFWNLLGSSYKKNAYKNSKFVVHSLYVLEIY